MEKMSLRAELVERVSKKGENFLVIELYITPKTKKLVFLDPAEKELLEELLKKQNNK